MSAILSPKRLKEIIFKDQPIETSVRARARYNLGEWAAKKMGYSDNETTRYAYALDFGNVPPHHHQNPIDKVYKDLEKEGLYFPRSDIAVRYYNEYLKALNFFTATA